MEKIRSLSMVEASFAYMHSLLSGNTQVTTLVTVDGYHTIENVRTCLSSVFLRHPLLAACIREEQGALWFYLHNDFSRIEISEISAPKGLCAHDLLQHELSDLLPSEHALWRMRMATERDDNVTHFLFTRNHAISDGHSTCVIFSDFLAALYGERYATSRALTGEFPRGLDEWVSEGMTIGCAKQSADDVAEVVIDSRSRLPVYDHAPVGNRATGVSIICLRESAAGRIINACHTHNVSVNDLFSAVLVKCFCDATVTNETNLFTAVSLRNRLGVPGHIGDIGCFITVLDNHVPYSGESVIELAARQSAALRESMRAWRPANRTHSQIKTSIAQLRESQHFPGISITNLGVVDGVIGARSQVVREFRTVVNRAGANYGIVLHLSTLHDQFTITLTYPTPSMPHEIVNRLSTQFSRILEAL